MTGPICVAAPVNRVQEVQAAGAADAIQLAVGRPHVDADQLLTELQAGDRRGAQDRAGRRAVEADQLVAAQGDHRPRHARAR
jgi:hypothetical protein